MEFYRGRRLRGSAALRDLMAETQVTVNDLIMPYFVVETDDENFKSPISSMPGQYQLSLKQLDETVKKPCSTV